MGTRRQPASDAEAKALASGLRLRILRLCLEHPLTNKEIAARLGLHPATVLHHVRTLVDTGFLAPQPERRGTRGAREIPYLATRKSWQMDVEADLDPHSRAMLDAFLQEVSLLPDLAEAPMSRLGIRLTDAQRVELLRRLTGLLEEFAEEYARPAASEGRAYSLFVALHPDVTRDPFRAPPGPSSAPD